MNSQVCGEKFVPHFCEVASIWRYGSEKTGMLKFLRYIEVSLSPYSFMVLRQTHVSPVTDEWLTNHKLLSVSGTVRIVDLISSKGRKQGCNVQTVIYASPIIIN